MVKDDCELEVEMTVETRKNFLGLALYEPEDNELYMSRAQRAHFAKVLKYWSNILLSETDGVKINLQTAEVYIDDIDRASFEESQRMSLRSSDRRRKLQRKVNDAYVRVQTGDYGYCKTCGAEIGISRLEARPTAEECINCKEVSESYEKRGT